MTSYAQIVVNMPAVTGIFDYALPPALEARAGVGSLVTVPFGKQTMQGVILHLVPEPSLPEVKSVLDLLDPQPVLTACQIALAQWLAEQTLSSLAACTGLMIPSGLSRQADVLYALPDHGLQTSEVKGVPPTQRRLLDLLSR